MLRSSGCPRQRKQAGRVEQCADRLVFDRILDPATGCESLRFVGSWKCGVRGCPVCEPIRALKTRDRLLEVVDRLRDEHGPGVYRRLVHLVLTVRSCPVSRTREQLDTLQDAFNRLRRAEGFPLVGYVRSVEATRSGDGGVHLHLHAIGLLAGAYGSRGWYWTKSRWAEEWQEALGVDYRPHVEVRGSITKPTVRAVATYATKGLSGLLPPSWSPDAPPAAVEVEEFGSWLRLLLDGLCGRQLVTWGGDFRSARAAAREDEELEEDDRSVAEAGLLVEDPILDPEDDDVTDGGIFIGRVAALWSRWRGDYVLLLDRPARASPPVVNDRHRSRTRSSRANERSRLRYFLRLSR